MNPDRRKKNELFSMDLWMQKGLLSLISRTLSTFYFFSVSLNTKIFLFLYFQSLFQSLAGHRNSIKFG
jgi:hypothetical protein